VENKISAFLNKLLLINFDISAQAILKNCFPPEYKISAQNPIFQITTNKKMGIVFTNHNLVCWNFGKISLY
jgi:hypothetical protein